MTERELLEKIKSSAEEIEVPERLSPDAIKRKLDEAVSENSAQENSAQESTDSADKTGSTEKERIVSISRKKRWYTNRKVAAAAVMLLVCTTGAVAATQNFGGMTGGTSAESLEMATAGAAQEELAAEEDVVEPEEKVNAGTMYVVAENYGEVYDVLKGPRESMWDTLFNGSDGAEEIAVEESAAESGATAEDTSSSQSMRDDEEYSKTNLQTEGVDESDIIKTDGEYIYVVDDDAVKIIDIRSSKMQEYGEIEVSFRSAADRVVEIYVDGDILNMIVQRETANLQEKEDTTYVTESVVACEVYSVNTKIETEVLTFDISNRKQPELLGTTVQDGYYKTSRKIGDIVYLFTEKYMELPDMEKAEAITDEEIAEWIPTINEKTVAADCIYLPEQGQCGLLISSIDVEKPDKVVDNALILNDYVNIYVSTNAIYLYEADYSGRSVSTQIAKFCFDKGRIRAVAATSVTGEVYDTFAVNEYQGSLRVLTTDWSGSEEENQLYLLDENLNLTGSLTGIAKGEQIYAARYLGDMVYFVTYRNTDPLFAVDLSDEGNPKILSELKITGFSEYLHFWGEDKLVGIGYETDPDTGEQKGLKLSMFDISNPANLTTVDSCVIAYVDYSPALYDYKSVLADADKNLLGFATETYGRDEKCMYQLFTWKDGRFESLMVEKLSDNSELSEYRGIYVRDMFYLVNTHEIISYGMEENYVRLQTLKW